ncbi:MAG: lipoyl synthase [PVC group bacterium]|nr:lipoyl synthase [PVC group bacterium]
MINLSDSRKKPAWLNKKINLKDCQKLHGLFKDLELNTICREAMCPNISECFSCGVATFLILGNTCTRKCKFCNVKKGMPQEIDQTEPSRVAQAVKKLGLKHVVVTSVTRDDLTDGGAGVFAQTIQTIHKLESAAVEVLVPDFKGELASIETVLKAKPEIFAHNLETVPRLYEDVRKGADYQRSLDVLRIAKQIAPEIYTKSGIMLGIGETEEEVIAVLADLRETGCDFLSIGQYLAPSHSHFPVKEFIKPEQFKIYQDKAYEIGFWHVESGPYVRSSYMASRYI